MERILSVQNRSRVPGGGRAVEGREGEIGTGRM